jgi:hypothetical protein
MFVTLPPARERNRSLFMQSFSRQEFRNICATRHCMPANQFRETPVQVLRAREASAVSETRSAFTLRNTRGARRIAIANSFESAEDAAMRDGKQYRRRSWLRYSVKTMLAAIAALAMLLGLQANRVHRQRIAVRTLNQLWDKHRAFYDYDEKADWIFKCQIGSTFPLWHLRDPWREFFCPLKGIFLEGIGDDDVAVFSGPLDAKWLKLRQCDALTDVGLRHLATTLPRLTELAIMAGPRITDAGFCDLLERLPDLECVEVSVYPQITDAALSRLARVMRLRELTVISGRSCRPWFQALRDAKQLRTLIIHCPTFVDAGFDQLRELKSLEHLYISIEAPIGEPARAAFEELRQALPQCKYLDLSAYYVSEPGQFTPR